MCFGMIILALVETAGIGSIGPFLAVATNPEIIQSNRYLSFFFVRFGFASETSFVIATGLVVIGITLIRNVLAAAIRYSEIRFGQMRNHSISTRLFAHYLSQPYTFFLNRNSSELSRNMLAEVQEVVQRFLIPWLETISKLVSAIAIIIFLVIMDPRVAILMAIALGGIYGGVYAVTRARLFRVGAKRVTANGKRFKIVHEAFGGIKDAKLMAKEQVFLEEFKKPSRKMAQYMTLKTVYGTLPKYILDTAIFSAIILIVLWFIHDTSDLDSAIALVSIYAVAGYRLMPILDQLYKNITFVRGSQPVVELIYNELSHTDSTTQLRLSKTPDRIAFHNDIRLDEVSFTYPETENPVLKHQTIRIQKNTTVGFIGESGCGKTTTVDIILGLLIPSAGRLLIDGLEITDANRRNWQACLGYVPQRIFLSDATISENIAFGVPRNQIDIERVKQAASIAKLDEFIENKLEDGYQAFVGEQGVRLSGGQAQRIGIARAVYHDPAVLVLDEATSALDTKTESAVMQAIDELTHQKTIIIIAHRLSTVEKCDHIFYLENGQIIAEGTFEDLVKTFPNLLDGKRN